MVESVPAQTNSWLTDRKGAVEQGITAIPGGPSRSEGTQLVVQQGMIDEVRALHKLCQGDAA